jgi:hypothetical protein
MEEIVRTSEAAQNFLEVANHWDATETQDLTPGGQRRIVRRFFHFIGSVEMISMHTISLYLEHRKTLLSQEEIERELAVLRSFCEYLITLGADDRISSKAFSFLQTMQPLSPKKKSPKEKHLKEEAKTKEAHENTGSIPILEEIITYRRLMEQCMLYTTTHYTKLSAASTELKNMIQHYPKGTGNFRNIVQSTRHIIQDRIFR